MIINLLSSGKVKYCSPAICTATCYMETTTIVEKSHHSSQEGFIILPKKTETKKLIRNYKMLVVQVAMKLYCLPT